MKKQPCVASVAGIEKFCTVVQIGLSLQSMEQKKTLIPPTVPMMDAGLARFGAASETAAVEAVAALLGKHGGKEVAREGTFLTYSFSNAFKMRYITVLVDASAVQSEPSQDIPKLSQGTPQSAQETANPSPDALRPVTALFREGNASTELMHYSLLLAALLVMGAFCWLLRSWWSLLACPVVIALYLWLQYAPERAFVRKADAIRRELEQ